jgi:hypothetical protein
MFLNRLTPAEQARIINSLHTDVSAELPVYNPCSPRHRLGQQRQMGRIHQRGSGLPTGYHRAVTPSEVGQFADF